MNNCIMLCYVMLLSNNLLSYLTILRVSNKTRVCARAKYILFNFSHR